MPRWTIRGGTIAALDRRNALGSACAAFGVRRNGTESVSYRIGDPRPTPGTRGECDYHRRIWDEPAGNELKYVIDEERAVAIADFLRCYTQPSVHNNALGYVRGHPVISLYMDSPDFFLFRQAMYNGISTG